MSASFVAKLEALARFENLGAKALKGRLGTFSSRVGGAPQRRARFSRLGNEKPCAGERGSRIDVSLATLCRRRPKQRTACFPRAVVERESRDATIYRATRREEADINRDLESPNDQSLADHQQRALLTHTDTLSHTHTLTHPTQ